MGLALIFGWQMQRDWGPLVEQEQPEAPSQASSRERHDTVFRSQASQVAEQQESSPVQQKSGTQELERSADLSESVASDLPTPAVHETTQPSRLRQPSAPASSSSRLRQDGEAPRQMADQESALVEDVPSAKERVARSAATTVAEEQTLNNVTPTSSSATELKSRRALSGSRSKQLRDGEKTKTDECARG